MVKKKQNPNNESDLEVFARSYVKVNPVMGPPPTPAAQARSNLEVDLCRFERYALDIINAHGYSIAVTDGKVYLAEPGKAHRRAVYDPKHLDKVARQIEDKYKNYRKLTPEQAKLPVAGRIRRLTPEHEKILIAARIALALPRLRRNIEGGEYSAEFASSMCRISAAVPDPDAGARLVSEHQRAIGRKGGTKPKLKTGLQQFIDRIVKELATRGKATRDRVWQHLVRTYDDTEGTDTGILDCDWVYVTDDILHWKDRGGRGKTITRLSLNPYIARAKIPS